MGIQERIIFKMGQDCSSGVCKPFDYSTIGYSTLRTEAMVPITVDRDTSIVGFGLGSLAEAAETCDLNNATLASLEQVFNAIDDLPEDIRVWVSDSLCEGVEEQMENSTDLNDCDDVLPYMCTIFENDDE